MIKNFIILFFLTSIELLSQTITFRGKVLDGKTGNAVRYANIGIKNKNFGTVADDKGNFNLSLSSSLSSDSITFSCVGYYYYSYPISGIKSGEVSVIKLKEKVNVLAEVVVNSKKTRIKTIGVRSHNPLLQGVAQSDSPSDILEIARVIRIKGSDSKILSAHLYHHYLSVDSVTFKVNFYRLKDEIPAARIIEKSVVLRVPVNKGWNEFNLAQLDLVVKSDFVIGLEFLPERKFNKSPNSFMYGAKLFAGGGFTRTSSLGKWEKIRGAAHSLYVTLRQ